MVIGVVIARYRYAERIGVRALAKTIGVSPATLNRIENGKNCDAVSLGKIINWLLGDRP